MPSHTSTREHSSTCSLESLPCIGFLTPESTPPNFSKKDEHESFASPSLKMGRPLRMRAFID
jgi:hypothetical protein